MCFDGASLIYVLDLILEYSTVINENILLYLFAFQDAAIIGAIPSDICLDLSYSHYCIRS